MKLDILIPDFSDLGAQRVAINVANFLSKKHEVRFVVFEKTGPFQEYLSTNIPIFTINEMVPNIPKIRVFFRALVYSKNAKENKTNIAISFSPITNFVVLWAKWRNKNLKTVVQEHAFPSLFLKDRENMSWIGELFYRHIFVKFYNKSDIFITLTEKIRDEFIKNFGIKNDGNFFRIVKNPIDIESIVDYANEKINDFSFNQNKEYIIGAGRLAEQKNFFRLIDVFSLVIKQKKNIELIILGQGPLEEKLKNYAESANISTSVHFLGFKKNPYKYIKGAGCFCLTSNWEALPQILAEAMALGKIPVAHNCPTGPAEMIQNEKTGLLIPYGDNQLFAEKIIWLFNHPEEKKKMEENAFQFAKREYSLEKCEEKYGEIIQYLSGL